MVAANYNHLNASDIEPNVKYVLVKSGHIYVTVKQIHVKVYSFFHLFTHLKLGVWKKGVLYRLASDDNAERLYVRELSNFNKKFKKLKL